MKNQQQQENQSDKCYKWIIMTQFFYASFFDSFRSAMLVPIWEILIFYYKVDENEITWLTNWIYILPFSIGFFFNIIIQKNYGLSQLLCGLFESSGMWIVWYAKDNYFWTVGGNAVMALGSSFLVQTPLYLSKLWFEPQERIISTFLGQYSSLIGQLLGFTYTALTFQGIEDWNQIVQLIDQVYFTTAILQTISFAISFIAFIKPNEANYEFLKREGQFKSIKKIFSQTEFFLDIACFSFCKYQQQKVFLFPWLYPSLLILQLMLLDESDSDIFLISFVFQFSGILVAIYLTYQLHKQSRRGLQQNYDFYLTKSITIGYVAFVLEILIIEKISSYFLIFLNMIIGGGIISLQSVILEALMEKHYPVSELALGQLLIGNSYLIMFLLQQILTYGIFYKFSLQVFGFFLIFPFCFLITFYKTKYVRFEIEA